ncbi:MAG: hypothetical protein M3119_11030 [Verrucomicrobiota bacterium]|nr:hypothetical protein [Verrucomicrobiota bacterium]
MAEAGPVVLVALAVALACAPAPPFLPGPPDPPVAAADAPAEPVVFEVVA